MDFETVIGLEIHCQINTKSKLFCYCKADSFNAIPNDNICPICAGFPGMLPGINREAIYKSIAAALALRCEIQRFSKFDRKNYFYPDLPKGFQISQYDQPISKNGYIDIEVGSEVKRIRINRLHIEDDAGKLTHDLDGTLCDYNRSGVPLMEIVSEADLRSVEEASAYAHEMQKTMRYVESSNCDMEKGMMRFDINISLRPVGASVFGTKVEVKNLNSFKALENALFYEIERQKGVLSDGGKIVQETRGWDDDKQITISQRIKEEADDYRYFPEPDLPPLEITPIEIDSMRGSLPELPLVRRRRFIQDYGIQKTDAEFLTESREMADYFENVVKASKDPKKSASFITTVLMKYLNESGKTIEDAPVSALKLGKLINLINDGTVSNNMAKTEIIDLMMKTGEDPEKIIQDKGLSQVSDISAIQKICEKIINENPGPVLDVKSGKGKALGFLVGMVMKETHGKANPKIVNDILSQLLI